MELLDFNLLAGSGRLILEPIVHPVLSLVHQFQVSYVLLAVASLNVVTLRLVASYV